MFFDINKSLCESFPGLDPIKLLDYPAEDVFNLIDGLVDYNTRQQKQEKTWRNAIKGADGSSGVIRRPAGDDWF